MIILVHSLHKAKLLLSVIYVDLCHILGNQYPETAAGKHCEHNHWIFQLGWGVFRSPKSEETHILRPVNQGRDDSFREQPGQKPSQPQTRQRWNPADCNVLPLREPHHFAFQACPWGRRWYVLLFGSSRPKHSGRPGQTTGPQTPIYIYINNNIFRII